MTTISTILQTNRLLQAMLDHCPEPVVVLDSDGKVLALNQAEQLLYANQNAVAPAPGMMLEEWVHPRNLTVFQDVLKRVFIGEQIVFEAELPGFDAALPIKHLAVPLRDQQSQIIGASITSYSHSEKYQALRESEEKYRSLFNKSPVYNFICDIDSLEILEVNDAVIQKYGYTRQEWDHKSMLDFRPKDDHAEFLAFMKTLKENYSTTTQHIWRHLLKNGEEIIVDINSHPVMYNGRRAVLAIARDITGEYKALEALKKSEEKYRTLIENAGDGIVVVGLDSTILEANSSICEIMGYNRDEILRLKSSDFYPPDDTFRPPNIDQIIEHGSLLNETVLQRKDGSRLDAEVSRKMIDGYGYLAIVRDITDRKKDQQKLKEYAYFFQNSNDLIAITNAEGYYEIINDEFIRATGYSEDELLKTQYLSLIHPADLEKTMLQGRNLQSGKSIENFETRIRNKKGEYIWIEWNVVPDTVTGKAYSIGRNITNWKKFENELTEHKEIQRLFIEHSPAALAMLDTDLKYLATSRRWLTDYNLRDQNIIGKSHYEVFPEIPQRWKDIHQRCLKGAVERNDDDAFVREDGSLQWLRWEIRPWHKADGQIGGLIMFTEIMTEQKKAIELFNYQFKNTPDTIAFINQYLKIDTINHGIPGLYSAEELIGRDCLSVLPEESIEPVSRAIHACFKTATIQHIEIRLLQNRWSQVRYVPMLLDDKVTHVMAISTDITVKKESELKLKRSEEKNRALIENISDAIMLLDGQLNTVYKSPSVLRLTGYTFDDVKGKRMHEFAHPEDDALILNAFKQARSKPGVPVQCQYRTQHKAGHYIWVEATILNLLENSSVQAFVVSCNNITERKLLEDQQRLITSIVDSSDDAIISTNLLGIVTSWNRGADKILGYTADEIIGHSLAVLIPPGLQAEEEDLHLNILAGKSVDHFETKRLRKDGTLIYVSMTVSPIVNTLGKITGSSIVLRNTTESKLQELERQRMIAELLQRNRDLEQFAHIISHNLRSPVANIMGITNCLLDLENEPDETEFLTQGLRTSVNNLDTVINDLNEILKMKREVSENKIVVRFPELLEQIQSSIQGLIQNEEVTFITDFDASNEMLSIRSYLYSIFYNLISNSIKYRKKDLAPVIQISSAIRNKTLVLVFKDNGMGINLDKNKDQVFGMYKRFHSHTEGKGMGLYMVKTQVETLGGTISINSSINEGTEFILTFEL
ncbi:MAG: PAS domain S-box protein [Bacteroidia bacterium]|jgi:PAS domain S-box-containing protein